MQDLYKWLLAVYCVGFLAAVIFTLCQERESWKDDQTGCTWIPTPFKRDVCLRPFCPLVWLLPSVFWPLFFICGIGKFLCATVQIWCSVDEETTCCGRSLPGARTGVSASTRRSNKRAAARANEDVELGLADGSADSPVTQQPEPVAPPSLSRCPMPSSGGSSPASVSSSRNDRPPRYTP